MSEENKIKSLYKNGLVKYDSFLDKSMLNELVISKDQLFDDYPYGQDDNLNKKQKADFVRPGSHMIWDLIEKKPIFLNILNNEIIQRVATRVLGSNYIVSSFYIRKTPKINEKLHPHIDNRGSLSFSILLDEIKTEQGETFFYKKSHKLPPPPFTEIEKFSHEIYPTTGKVGDTYFWFPDCWHGRNINSEKKETTILMCHLGNSSHPRTDSTGRLVNYSKNKIIKKDHTKREKILNNIFKLIGNSPNNFFSHLIYNLIYFKVSLISKKAINQEAIFTRKKYGENTVDNFSIKNYLKATSPSRVFLITVKTLIKKLIGKKISGLIKNFIR
tara:strand:+ start:460 stop:1446 length:987 start_codon:yes stop_codon:yes gene_type:complete